MASVPHHKWQRVADLYQSGLSMRAVAEKMRVSIEAITYVLRKSGIPRRSPEEAQRLAFESRKPSFSLRKKAERSRELQTIGAMLYWAEGYKRDTAFGLDFANSDPDMAEIFVRFLQNRYTLDLKRLRCSVYCYADQELEDIVRFWVWRTGFPPRNFKNHYIRKDFTPGARKLPYGVLHIRYHDKKLLRDMLNLIESYRSEYCVGVGAVNRGGL
jgi:hypothetical protein